jgi:hypothetical protein
VTHCQNDDDGQKIGRCEACNATVITEAACRGGADANTVCTLCGMTLADSPFEGDYFDVIMRAGRVARRAPRVRQ